MRKPRPSRVPACDMNGLFEQSDNYRAALNKYLYQIYVRERHRPDALKRHQKRLLDNDL